MSLLAMIAFSARAAAAQPQAGIPVELRLPQPPVIAVVRGAWYAVIDLHVGNLLDQPLRLTSVRAAVPGSTVAIREYSGAELRANLKAFGAADSAGATLLPPGGRVIVYLWIPMRAATSSLDVSVVLAAASGAERTVALESLPIPPTPPVEIGPPLRGGDWVAANGPDPDSMPGHNRLLVNVAGRIVTPQRFATDWVRLGTTGGSGAARRRGTRTRPLGARRCWRLRTERSWRR
ncbi:hypothetical protein HKM21_25940 [Longimicrobium terrae]|nr:hypothetical protein [Longimicrobium terrae]